MILRDAEKGETKGQRPPRPRKLTKHEVAQAALVDAEFAIQCAIKAQNQLAASLRSAGCPSNWVGRANKDKR